MEENAQTTNAQNVSTEDVVKNGFTMSDIKTMKEKAESQINHDAIIKAVECFPVVGQGVAFMLTQNAAHREFEFYRKFIKMLYELEDTSNEQREKFGEEAFEACHDCCECVLFGMVDRMDNVNKAEVLGRLIFAKINGHISIDDFFRLSVLTERIPYVDFKHLPNYSQPIYEPGISELLYSTGVLKLAKIADGEENKYVLSRLGVDLLKFGLGQNVKVKDASGTSVVGSGVWE